MTYPLGSFPRFGQSESYGWIDVDVAKQFLADPVRVGLHHCTGINDDAAEVLSTYESQLPDLNGLTELSDASAESLSRHRSNLALNGLTELSDAAAESLSKHRGDLVLNGLTKLSDAAAESLSKHQDDLHLNDLIEISDDAAESLANKKGPINEQDPEDWVAWWKIQ